MVGIIVAGIPRTSSVRASHCRALASTRPVTAALVASVTWSDPSERIQVIHVSMVPKRKCSPAVREGSKVSRSHWALVAETLGASRRPSAWRSRQLITVRRSCQPMAGPIGRPVRASQTTVVARWLAMPMPSTGPVASAARAVSRTDALMASASNST